jgi:hypothetical protein
MPYFEKQMGSGANLKAAARDIRDDQLQSADGCRFDRAGAVSSDWGDSVLETPSSSTVYGTAQVARSDGSHRIVKNSSIVREEGTIITPAVGWHATDQISVVSYNGYAYITDGTEFRRWDGTSSEQVGLEAPSAAPSLAPGGPGTGSLDVGKYKVAYTFWNGIAESNFSPIGTGQLTGTQDDLALAGLELGPAGTLSRNIYRSDKNQTPLFYEGSIEDNTTTTYTITNQLPPGADTADEGTAAAPGDEIAEEAAPVPTIATEQERWQKCGIFSANAVRQRACEENMALQARNNPPQREWIATNLGFLADWRDHDPPPSGLSHLTFLTEQLFGISDNKVFFTKTAQPEHWPILNQFPVGRQTGETIRALVPLDKLLVVYTDTAVYRFEAIGASFEDSRLELTDAPVGLAGEWAVTELTLSNGNAVHLYLAKSGIYLFDNATSMEVSQFIEPLFTSTTHADRFNLNSMNTAVMASRRDKVWLSYAAGTSTTNNRTLLIDAETPNNPKFAISNTGYTSLNREILDNVVVGGNSSGQVLKIGTSLGSSVLWEPRTKDYAPGGDTILKAFTEVVLDADLASLSTTVTLTTDTGATTSFTITDSTGRKRIRRHLPTTLKGRSVSVKLSSTGVGERHLYNVGLGYTATDRP